MDAWPRSVLVNYTRTPTVHPLAQVSVKVAARVMALPAWRPIAYLGRSLARDKYTRPQTRPLSPSPPTAEAHVETVPSSYLSNSSEGCGRPLSPQLLNSAPLIPILQLLLPGI